jgi:hypothetical protein
MVERPKSWRAQAVDLAGSVLVLSAFTGFGVYCIVAGHLALLRRRWRWRRKVARDKANGHFTGGGNNGRTSD